MAVGMDNRRLLGWGMGGGPGSWGVIDGKRGGWVGIDGIWGWVTDGGCRAN